MIKKEDSIRRSLVQQLTLRNSATDYFLDLVDRYMAMWRISLQLENDIEDRGVKFMDVSASGHEMWKNNPSVGELVRVTTQMAKLLSQMDLQVGNVAVEDNDDDDF